MDQQNNNLAMPPDQAPKPKMGMARQLWSFLRIRKKWWLAPILIILFLFGIALVFAQTSPLAPFIYTIF